MMGRATLVLTQTLGNAPSLDLAIADVDGDDDLDLYVSNGGAGSIPDELWLNDTGQLTLSPQRCPADGMKGLPLRT